MITTNLLAELIRPHGDARLSEVPILPIGARTSRERSASRVALAPSGGRAGGALLTLILRGSMLDRREDGQLLQGARRALALRRPASCGRFRGLERADAAVARRA